MKLSLLHRGCSIGMLSLLAALTAQAVEPPPFRHIYRLDAEYALDLLSGEIPWDWRDAFYGSPSGFQISGGSLNIKHLFIDEKFKARAALVEDRFWFRFAYNKRQGLERNSVEAPLELEIRPTGPWFVSLVGEPDFDKSTVDIGAALRWGAEEGRSVKLTYLWPDFDNNHAYANQSVSENTEKFYHTAPREARLAATWIGGPWSLRLEGRHSRPWERESRDLATNAQALEKERGGEAFLDLRLRAGSWTWGVEGESWGQRSSVVHAPAAPAADREVSLEKEALRAALQKDFSAKWRARAGGGFVHQRGGLNAVQDASDERYKSYDRLIFLEGDYAPAEKMRLDAAYVVSRQQYDILYPAATPESGRRTDHRARLGLRYDVKEGTGFRAATAWELNRGDSEKLGSFDGGTLQFQTVF